MKFNEGVDVNVSRRIEGTSLIGPVFIIATFLLYVMKDSNTQILPLGLALFGFLSSAIFRWKGFIGSTLVLGAWLSFRYFDIPIEERFFEVGVSFSLILTFLITVLSLSFADQIISEVQVESESRLSNLMRLDEKLKLIKTNHENAATKASDKEKELLSLQFELQSKNSELAKAKLELSKASQQTEKLLADLFKNRGEMTKLTNELEMCRELADKKEKDEAELQAKSEEVEQYIETLIREKEQLKIALHRLEKDLIESKAKNALSATAREWEGKYRQLRQQFTEKSTLLDETRRELFQTTEKLAKIDKERDEHTLYGRSDSEKGLEDHIARLEAEITSQQREIEMLEDIILNTANSAPLAVKV